MAWGAGSSALGLKQPSEGRAKAQTRKRTPASPEQKRSIRSSHCGEHWGAELALRGALSWPSERRGRTTPGGVRKCYPPRAALVVATATIFGGFVRRDAPSACTGAGGNSAPRLAGKAHAVPDCSLGWRLPSKLAAWDPFGRPLARIRISECGQKPTCTTHYTNDRPQGAGDCSVGLVNPCRGIQPACAASCLLRPQGAL